MFLERDRQDDCVGIECIPQRLGDDRGSNRPSLRGQRLGQPATRDGHVDVLTGKGVGDGLAYLAESYNRIAHNASPIRVDIGSPAFDGAACANFREADFGYLPDLSEFLGEHALTEIR
jgi:hypothetical protein